jgi:DNA repair protein RadC
MAAANSNPVRSTRRNTPKPDDWVANVVDLNPRQQRLVGRALKALENSAVYRTECFSTPGAVRAYLKLRLATLAREKFHALWMDCQNHLITVETLFVGTLTQASVYPREVVRAALANNAAAVIFAHNHPSGVAKPSRADEMLTSTLKEVLVSVDVKLLDHFIVAGNAAPFSFAERGIL